MKTRSWSDTERWLIHVGWWTLAVICTVYGGFALVMAASEIRFLLGLAPEIKHRATPLVFVAHSLAGAVALLAGPLQFNPRVRRHLRLHRAIGRSYVIAAWVASIFAIADVGSFAVSTVSKMILALTAALWFVTTTVGYRRIRGRQFAEHREWMIRSFSLSFFFVTFSLWVPGLASTSLPQAIGYPLALILSGGLNLCASEVWIRFTRTSRARAVSPPIGIPAPNAFVER